MILAGGNAPDDLAAVGGSSERAGIKYGNRTFLEVVREAVDGVGRIVQVGGPPAEDGVTVEAGRTFVESVGRGLAAVEADQVLIVTADLPCLRAEMVSRFLESCPEADLCYPILRAESCEAAFPDMARTTLRLREGRFTGGNLSLVRTEALRRFVPLLEQAYAARKSPIRLGGMVGWGLVGRLILGRLAPATLSIASLEAEIGRFLRADVRAVFCQDAEIGADIDTAEQYVHVEFYILALDATTEPFFAALERARARGVTVRVLSDHLMSVLSSARKETLGRLAAMGA
ncbi:MAG: NTP transferase domain-containing protein, partial [Fimbriimonadaceae bacterium]|nr:NTP transferase domain-containing protein [Fimbriimonadaceae bacterium]